MEWQLTQNLEKVNKSTKGLADQINNQRHSKRVPIQGAIAVFFVVYHTIQKVDRLRVISECCKGGCSHFD